MTPSDNTSLTPREETNDADTRLFAFYRVRDAAETRFYPGAGTRLRFASKDVDTLNMPALPCGLLAAGDSVRVSYRGVCVFRGDVSTITEARGRGDDAVQTVVCSGPWAKMARLVYRQNWFTGDGFSPSSRLVLNQYEDGSAQNLNSELYEIASRGAAACGYSVAWADISVSTQRLPFDECRDITVADAIRRELRFFPKAVCRFDYSGATPALKIGRNANASTASYVADIPKNLREYVYNAHPITGVDLEIEAVGTIEDVEYHAIRHQTAGNTAAGNPDCLYATLQIRGASSSSVRQSFKSVTEEIPGNLNDVSWWKARHPRLANVAASAVYITDGARSPANYPRISAATAGELEEAGLHCEVSRFTCKATIQTADDREEDVYLTLNFLTTNATGTAAEPKTYTWTAESSAESGETVPEGLAAAILADRSGVLLSERMSVRLGDALPVLGDAIVEPEGEVFLQSMDIDCASLVADLQFGVPEHLAPEDMASLLSGFRNKCAAKSATVRRTGKTGDAGADVSMGAIPPLSSSEFAPGTKAKTTIKASSGGGKIVLDSQDEELGSETISVHSVKKAGSGPSGSDSSGSDVKILSTGDIELGNDGVTSLNGKTGDLSIIGGKGVRVETDGQTIKISADPDKEDEDPDPNADPCGHPDGGEWGGGDYGGDGGMIAPTLGPGGVWSDGDGDVCNHDC